MPAPRRISWAVARLDVQPGDRVLEIGCGPGWAVDAVCRRLDGGRVVAIDRSPTALSRCSKRNAEHLAARRAELQQTALADLRAERACFDKALAVNVNLFWTGAADRECLILREVLKPGGIVHAVYEPPPGGSRDLAAAVAANFERTGFEVTVESSADGSLLDVCAKPST